MNRLGYFVFKESGVKIDLDNFNLLPYDYTFGSDTDIINITNIPWWDLAEITDNMNEINKKELADILKKAKSIKAYAYNILKEMQTNLKDISSFEITDIMVIELVTLYNINKKVSIHQVADIVNKHVVK